MINFLVNNMLDKRIIHLHLACISVTKKYVETGHKGPMY